MDRELIEKAKNVKSGEELAALLKENGIDVPDDKIDEIYSQLKLYGEIGDDDLNKVSGGSCYSPEGYLKTTMGYGCGKYERVDGAISGVEGTCYLCKYWDRTGSYMPLLVMGQALKCMHPDNRR